MDNNAELGMTIQKTICDEYGIVPNALAQSQFEANYNKEYEFASKKTIKQLFSELGQIPVDCLTFVPSKNPKEKFLPHNFILSGGSTLSIRTNKKGEKVAPRVVGQAGINTFNEFFGEMAGYEIEDKNEIKKIVFENIHLMMPTFIDYLFTSDYTAWIQLTNEKELSYVIFDKNRIVDISPEREAFSFTRDLSTWTESTTLKYNNKSLAEIQIHKNRTFKFRFLMSALSELLVKEQQTTETFGITAEKVICDLFGIPVPKEYKNRYSNALAREIKPTVSNAFKFLPKAVESTGAQKGARGANSKCPYDFMLEGRKTLSLKTNTGRKICPPDVGQPGAETCYAYFKEYIEGDEATPESFKKMVLKHISEIMPIYVKHLFDCDYLLWIFKRDNEYKYKIYDSNFSKNIKWKKENFSFTKQNVEEWNESNTVKYLGLTIGEFQVHKNRSSYKFRFDMENFEHLIKTKSFE